MSKRNSFVVTTAPRLAALTGVCLILAAGCNQKKTEGGAGSSGAGNAWAPGAGTGLSRSFFDPHAATSMQSP